MTEIPHSAFSTVGIIGPGRIGSALAEAFHLTGQPINAIAGRTANCPKTHQLAQRVGAKVMSPQALAKCCSLIFIAVPDDDITAVSDAITWTAGSGVVHVSGATELSALHNAVHCHAHSGGFHPLQSISQHGATAASFQHCTITIEADYSQLNERLTGLATQLGAHINVLPAQTRMRYHAAANHASALLIALLTDMATLWKSWGGSEENMMHALLPLMNATLTAASTKGIANALTGPLTRGDIGTLKGHLSALAALDVDLAQRYALGHKALLSLSPLEQRQSIAQLIETYARSSPQA